MSRPADLIPASEAAKLCGGVALATVHRWILRGRLEGWRIAGRIFVSRAAADALWQKIVTPPVKPGHPLSKRERRKMKEWTARVLAAKGVKC